MALSLDSSNYLAGSSGSSGAVSLSCSNAGNVIVLVATQNYGSAGQGISSITASGATFAKRLRIADSLAGVAVLEIWTGYASGTFNETITVNLSASSSYLTLHIFGVSGAPSSSYFDTDAGLPYYDNIAPCDPISVNTSTADTFIIGAFRLVNTSNPTAGTGFTNIRGIGYTLSEYKIVASSQSGLSVPVGTGSGTSNGGIADAIQMASGVTTINSAAGAWSFGGVPSTLATQIAAAQGVFSWSGVSSNLSTQIPSTVGAWSWAGQASTLGTQVAATVGAWSWGGQAASLATQVAGVVGTWTWTGVPATVSAVFTLNATVGAWTWAGQATTLAAQIAAVPGSWTWAGVAATFAGATIIQAAPGTYSWSGLAAGVSTPTAGAPVRMGFAMTSRGGRGATKTREGDGTMTSGRGRFKTEGS